MQSLFNRFPKLNVKFVGHPANLQKLADIKASILYLKEIIPLERLPKENGFIPIFIDYSSIKVFRDLCFSVQNELAENKQNNLLKLNKKEYHNLLLRLDEVLKLFNKHEAIMNADMSFLSSAQLDYNFYKENWYKLIYEELIMLQRWVENLSDIQINEDEKIIYLDFIKLFTTDANRRKYKMKKEEFIEKFENCRGKKLAYLLMALMENSILKKDKEKYKSVKGLVKSIASEFDAEIKYEGVNKYFYKNEYFKDESEYKDIEDALKTIFFE